ncbi:hypothetical protein [Flavobacterium cheonhonense]|nr:hypothetical protein [Flavobacterium cheonhonense]
MAKSFIGNKMIICLDQYCTSGMFDDQGSKDWKEIYSLLLEGYKKDKLVCPIPYEHFLETSQKDYASGVNTINSFQTISGNYIFKFELLPTTQLITSVLRKNNLTANTFFFKDKELIFNLDDNYNKTADFKKKFKATFDECLDGQNQFRNVTRTLNYTIDIKMLQIIMQLEVNKFIDRLQDFYKKERTVIRGDKFGNKEIANWIDLIIHRLVVVHKMNKKEISKLLEYVKFHGFSKFPHLDIRTSLMALSAVQHKKEQESDHFDFMRLVSGLPPSDYLFTDKRRKNELLLLGLDKKYNCKIFSGTKKDLEEFKEILRSIIE